MRCIVVDSNVYPDKDKTGSVCTLTCFALAKRTNKGLWHFKAENSIYKITRFSKDQFEEYHSLSKIMPGTLIDIYLTVNEYTQKQRVGSYEIVPDTDLYTEDLLYLG